VDVWWQPDDELTSNEAPRPVPCTYWTVMLSLFAAPLAIILAYSFLTRELGRHYAPWSIESYQRLADPIIWHPVAFVLDRRRTTVLVWCRLSVALFISRAGHSQEPYLTLFSFTSFLSLAWIFLLLFLINTSP